MKQYNLDDIGDFEQYMLDYYTKLYPTGMMQVYNTHPEKQPDGSTIMVANPDRTWSEWELPILVALKTIMISPTKTLYENNLELYRHNYSPENKMPVVPIEYTGTLEQRVYKLERDVAILKG
jgi:hypothetical protein